VDDQLVIYGEELSKEDMVYLHAGLQAGLPLGQSLTNYHISGAERIIPEHTRDELRDANARGVIVHTRRPDGSISVLRDINSFVSLTSDFNYEWTKNTVIRTLNSIMKSVHNMFVNFKGKVPNDDIGRGKLRQNIHRLMIRHENIPTIQNHSLDKLIVCVGERADQVELLWLNTEMVDMMEELDNRVFITGGRQDVAFGMNLEGWV
jgi:hypothetical protein